MDSTTTTPTSNPFGAPPATGNAPVDSAVKSAASSQRTAEATAAADAALAERAARRADGQDMLSRVVKGAHETIDRLADTAAPHVHKLEDSLTTANVKAHSRASHAKDVGDEWAESLRCTVRENPLAALAAALALGVVIASILAPSSRASMSVRSSRASAVSGIQRISKPFSA
ncbi:MAG: hypothetical protein ABIN96_00740, partial [Rubrivivax sp.]